ncbi:hypothetical protein EDB85DRAFT_1884914 [Lactarius pseudohatsudake]|nr:hypothetical protein EDB85DRAFT_1884914 [Lactarius pseudohatsudake]
MSGLPCGHYPRPYKFEHWQPGEDFDEHHRSQHLQQFSDRPTPESQFARGSDVVAGNKRPNSISLPQASSVDLTSTSLPLREETEVPSSSNRLTERHEDSMGPMVARMLGNSVPPVFELGRHGDLAENHFEARAGQDIALPVPGAMSLGHFETWEGKGTETNEIALGNVDAHSLPFWRIWQFNHHMPYD